MSDASKPADTPTHSKAPLPPPLTELPTEAELKVAEELELQQGAPLSPPINLYRPPTPPPSAGAADVQKYMGKWIEVHLSDGRLITGRILCVDNNPNIIMCDTEERWERLDEPRHVGLAMVARQHAKKIYLLPDEEEEEEEEPTL